MKKKSNKQTSMIVKLLIIAFMILFTVGCFLPSVTRTDIRVTGGPSTFSEVIEIGKDEGDLIAEGTKSAADGEGKDVIKYSILLLRKTTDESMLKFGFAFSLVGGGLAMLAGIVSLILYALSFKFKTGKLAKFFLISCLIMTVIAFIGTIFITANRADAGANYAIGLGRIFMLVGSALAIVFSFLLKDKKAK